MENSLLRFLCAKNERTVVLTQYQVKASYQNKFLEALSDYMFSSLRKTGNIMAEAYYERGDACVMWTIERWGSHTFYKKNKKSTEAKAVSALIKNGLTSKTETFFIADLESISKEIDGDALTIMLFVDVKAGTEKYFKSIIHDLMQALLEDPGVLLYQLSQVDNPKTRFVVYKKFRNWDTFQYHLKEPAFEPVLKFLQTSIKEPPFEKGYHHLIQFGQL